jgi:hypothetical protein
MTCNEFISRPRPSLAPSDLSFIVKLAKRGFKADTIYQRIMERLVWRSYVPDVAEINLIMAAYKRAIERSP